MSSPTQQAAALAAKIDLASVTAAELAAQRSTTAAAGKIPVALGTGKLDAGWLPGGGGGGVSTFRLEHDFTAPTIDRTGSPPQVLGQRSMAYSYADLDSKNFKVRLADLYIAEPAGAGVTITITLSGKGGAVDKVWTMDTAAAESDESVTIDATQSTDDYDLLTVEAVNKAGGTTAPVGVRVTIFTEYVP